MRREKKTVFILTEEEYKTFEKIAQIAEDICNAQREEYEIAPCEKCPCFLVCDKSILDSMKEFFECDIESE